MQSLNRISRRTSPIMSLGVLFLLGPLGVQGSQVDYSTCPGYPLTACPSGYAPVAIPDNNNNGARIILPIPYDSEGFVTDVDVWFYITHTYQGDLRVSLTNPAGTVIELVNRPGFGSCDFGFSSDNFGFVNPNFFLHEFVLDDGAAASYRPPDVGCPGIANVEGAWRPTGVLADFFGQSKVGVWELHVQDLEAQDVGTLWVWGMNIQTEPATPPVVDLAAPEDFACACPGGAITGTANEPDGIFDNYTLEWALDSAGPWSLISSAFNEVSAGALGVFPANVPEGYVYLRLVATNVIAQASAFAKVVYADRSFGGAIILDPTAGDILGGSVCMNKVSASDYCFANASLSYAPVGGGFTTFYSTTSPVQEFPSWNTSMLPDGNYTLRVTGTTTCGHTASDDVAVVVDNTPPVALIDAPTNCEPLGGLVQIVGTVTDAHLSGWTLQYTGGKTSVWQTIATGNTNVVDGILATWNTDELTPCSYTLRLLASDASAVSCYGSNTAEFLTSVEVGSGVVECLADIDFDGDVDLMDYADFSVCVSGPDGDCVCGP
jgi:subtilisin-like proprotein convertase family protein